MTLTVDRHADARDRRGAERDRRADARDQMADRRRRRADARDDEDVDLRDGHALTVLRGAAGADRLEAASDRAVAAADRRQAGKDRQVAAQERDEAQEERTMLQTDDLTGLLQRGTGLIALEDEAARSTRTGSSFVVAFIDVDGLKHANDEYGHACGDAVLRTLGGALLRCLRSYDLAMRYGGDEFVCILPGFGIAAAQLRFTALQATLASGEVPVSVTFGLAKWKRGEDTDALLARADAALYDARKATREADDPSAVAAHSLLNSSAVVSLGIDTLHGSWDRISPEDRAHLLERMQVHSTSIDDRLREIAQGR
jgi:diguanylate cyclase (GGDEF)-like protein